MNLIEFLDLGAQLERVVAECYQKLGGLCEEGALRDQLRFIANEEIGHANALATAKNYARKMPDLFGQQLLEEDVKAGLELAKRLSGDIEESKDLALAMTRLAGLERQFEKVHVDTSVEIKDSSLKNLFKKLSGDDQNHAHILDDILRRFPPPAR